MVTLTGLGGIGKTRLALRLAAAVADEHADGARYVELADVTNPDLVVARVAAAVGVTQEQDRPLPDTLTDALRSRELVLTLDNCEHLLDACARLCQQLLAGVPGLRLITTSREPLHVAGETVWSVPPLAVAIGDRPAGDAVRLFAERAGATARGFALTDDNASMIEEICQILDGIPLAIELAAAWVRTLSVAQIRDRIANRFGLLTSGGRAMPARHRTLRATIDWSHDLLAPAEQALLRRLSVFAGWSLEMAEQVCADDLVPTMDILDTLAALVDKSLVVRESEVLGQARFRMLDTIRAYAAEKLAEAGEAALFKRRFLDHVLAISEQNFAVGMALVPAPWQARVDVFRQYDADASNIWQALSECLATGDVATGLRICTAVRPCLLVRGEFALGREWLDAFLSRPEAGRVDPAIRGQALIGQGQLTLPTDPVAAEQPARAGLELCRASGDAFWTAAGLNLLSEITMHTGHPDLAESLGLEAMTLAESAGDGWNKGWALGIRAAIAGIRGQLRAAAELASASVTVMRSIDQRWGVARAQLGLGDLARLHGNHADAQRRYTEALTYLREMDAQPEIARCLSGLGRIALDLGDLAQSRKQLTESLQLCRDTGTRIGVARGLESFAALAVREGDAERAVLLAAATQALREASGLPPLPDRRASRYLGPARAIDPEHAARLWAQGLTIGAEDAVALAIEPGSAEPGAVPATAPPTLLTPREFQIATLIADGYTNRAIAEELVIAEATVARHVANIMAKLECRSRAKIAAWIASSR